ncbi:hypothetical protein [Vibrio vulnificus]|uniref:hypothetical protein n=1 Tax=Vibrio vulnificus TaxID=672 RepID=UPI004058BAE3
MPHGIFGMQEFCGESGLRKAGLCGIHPLTRRYGYQVEFTLMSVNWFKLEYYSAIKLAEELDDNPN